MSWQIFSNLEKIKIEFAKDPVEGTQTIWEVEVTLIIIVCMKMK
ncbi:hypothetical protein BOH78_1311 [Pichia kudriavzevii]|uniref:Uncharacterized protein n=1 Tax=Pichia kudriavzevii TaxID=4909 RepID=A0A099NSH1_PICKU|nr:hypothetical protein JL09_g5989 [Pichia kudriavzevii]ONH71091.1 hypothetical protein BOH78_4749 [Pichia kudriavzevii]ONH76349.1 hypothetical protein BOH78_1311 [Pichia kudriavzevii]